MPSPHNYFPISPGSLVAAWRGMSRVHTVQRWGHGWGGVAILIIMRQPATICVHRACDGRYGLHQVYQQVSSVTIMYTLSILYTARWPPCAVRGCVRACTQQPAAAREKLGFVSCHWVPLLTCPHTAASTQ